MQRFVISKVRRHQAFPQFAVIRNEKVQQLVDDNVIAQFAIQLKQFAIETQIARR